MSNEKLRFAGQLLDAEWKPDYFCIEETDGLKRGRKVMLVENLNPDEPDGFAVYAFKVSPKRISLSYHTEFNSHFMPMAVLHD